VICSAKKSGLSLSLARSDTVLINKTQKDITQYLLESEGVGARERGWEEREVRGEEGSNDPIIVCTYE
jgi:hypothetical protein